VKQAWQIPGCRKDAQSITRDWHPSDRPLIEGVRVKESRNVIKGNGHLTEMYRSDWLDTNQAIDQVFQVAINPGGLSAWHAHGFATDRLFCISGRLLIVLYDGRQDSSTYRLVNEFYCGLARPTLIVVPPGVWHGVHNIGHEPGILVNMVDKAYRYEDPDHWRLPADTREIPYRFSGAKGVCDALG
jgi:dTDP-4-dehydrorhamnose 3,5-epimerase